MYSHTEFMTRKGEKKRKKKCVFKPRFTEQGNPAHPYEALSIILSASGVRVSQDREEGVVLKQL